MTPRVSRASPGAQVLEEASEWFVDLRLGDADAAAQVRFDQWLRRSPENIQAYLEITEIWADLPAAGPPAADITALVANARRQANVFAMDGTPSRRVKSKTFFPRRLLIAACAIFACAAVASLYWLGRAPEYSTGIGEQRFVTLADGSTIQLNTRTRLTVRFTDNERRIDLAAGQALFTAARDPARPFVVDSNGTRIRAVGTQFDIYRKTAGTVLTVVEGRVAVDDGPLLGEGEQATITPASVLRVSFSIMKSARFGSLWTTR